MNSSLEIEALLAADPAPSRPLGGGALLAAISQSVVGMQREHYGRGAMHAKTYVNDDLVVVVTRENGLTPLERTLLESGAPERVIAIREQFLTVMAGRYTETIERLTGRRVLAFLHQLSLDPDIITKTFVLDRAPEGFDATEAPRADSNLAVLAFGAESRNP